MEDDAKYDKCERVTRKSNSENTDLKAEISMFRGSWKRATS